ncbi:glycosyl hydrolases 18 family protein, partial [Vibrio parahaemolyticus V-223/04]
SSTR